MKKAGLFFFLVMLLEIPMALVVHFVQGLFPADSAVLVSIFMTQGYLLLSGIIYMVLAKKSPVKDFRLKPIKLTDFFLALLVLITANPMASLLNVVSQFFAKNEMSTAIYSVTEQVPPLVGILIIGCLPGVIEELLYRGILFHAFRERSIWTGVIISGLSFGFMHMNFNQIMYAVYLGILFALIVEVTDSLLTTMLLHMLFNAANTMLLYILPKLYEMLARYSDAYADFDMGAAMDVGATAPQLMAMVVFMFPFAAGGLVLTVLLLKYIAKRNGREFTWKSLTECRGEMKQAKPVTVCLALGWLICLASATAALFA